MSDNPHVQYANAKLRHKKQKSQGFHSDAKHAEREMIRISNLHKIKTGKHINDHAEKLVAHHEKAKEIKRQYVQHSTDLIHAKKAGDKERMERAAKGKAQAEKDHLAHTGEPAEEKFVEYKRPMKEGKEMKTFKELYEACCSACEKRDEMEESDSGLAAKADKSGVSIGTLRKVYKRGVAAWNSGHRPGTTPQQWGMARVNSYITKGKGTYHGADKDLREEEVEIDEAIMTKKRATADSMFNHHADKVAEHEKSADTAYDKGDKKLGDHHTAQAKKHDAIAQKHYDALHKIGRAPTRMGQSWQPTNEEIELEEVAKDKESGLPKKYVSGLSPSTAKARAAHWEKMDKLSDKDPAAYEPAPGDATAKTKESKHTIKARKMFGEACWTGYKRVGMKKKGDKMVPNCVPANEESDRNQRLRDALEKVKKDFTKSHADKKTTIKMPTPAPKPEPTSVGGGMDYYPKAPYGRRYMGDSVEMDGEQIDELSKDTLASYNRKAWDDRQANQHKAADLSKKSVLYRGKNYTKDERDNAEKAHNELGKLTHKYGTRTKGIETSEKKAMAKEEVEQIDELSKGTLRRYIDDAGDQESDVRHTLKRTEKSKHISAGAKDELKKLADRRKAGIRLASDKRGYYKGSDAKANFTHGDAKVPATEETQKGKNVVPPPAGTIATTGGIQEEENENKPLGKVMRAGDGKKKFKVFVKNANGNVVKVGFGDPNMEIKRDDPERRKNFRARHNCDTAKDRTTPRYWSCRQWRSSAKVEA